MAGERVLFENEEWAVSDAGLEHKRTGYFIARDALAQRRSDGLWCWPVHVAEKTWCAMPAFMEAFACAAAAYGVGTDVALARSFRMARCEVAARPGGSARSCGASVVLDDLIPFEGAASLVRAERPGPLGLRRRTPKPAPTLADRRASRTARGRGTAGLRWAGARLVRLLRAAWATGRDEQRG